MKNDQAREQKRQEASARHEEYLKRTPLQQREKLDLLLGKGIGAVRERKYLQELIKEGKGKTPFRQINQAG